jgi:2-oxoglutarate dehydrogenase complex dehydrogenase (E1) component-like enzyme
MRTSISARANLDLIEENYRRWLQDPHAVDSGWAAFFEGRCKRGSTVWFTRIALWVTQSRG